MNKATKNSTNASNEPAPLMNKPSKTGIPRMIAAAGYSYKGFKAAWIHEEAFRLECYMAVIFIPLSFVIGDTLAHQLLLVTCCVLLLLVELINSAIEAIVDRIGIELHPLSGQAKDIGSAAVFLTTLLFIGIWCISIWQFINHW